MTLVYNGDNMSSKNYTIDELYKKLRVSQRTILREIKRGRLKVEKVGRRYIVPEKFLQEYLNRNISNRKENIRHSLQNKKGEMITLLQKIVSMPSESESSRDEVKLAVFLKNKLESFGIRSLIYKEGEAVAVRGSFGLRDTGLLLDCPLDTTPAGDFAKWTYPPYEGVIKGGKMFGRGTSDCKAGIVAMIYAVLALKEFVDEEEVRVELVFDGGEQTGAYHGMRLTLKKGLPVKSGIIGYAGTGNDLAIGSRGYHRFRVKSLGYSVHTGARYKSGVNAIVNLAGLITEMEHIRFPKSKNKYFDFGSKLTFSSIHGGKAINIVPDDCEALLDVRTVPDLKRRDVEAIINKIIKSTQLRYKGFDVSTEYLLGSEGYVLKEDEYIIKCLRETVKDVSNREPRLIVHGPAHIGNLLHRYDIPVVVWGPTGANFHSYDEYVEVDSIPKTANIYAQTALNFFGAND